MTTPKRIQMHRRKGGWRKDHPDAVIVARKGNGPAFDVFQGRYGNPFPMREDTQAERRAVTDLFRIWLMKKPAMIGILQAELRGKDLACWCPLDQPCHADVLLEIANGPTR